ILQQHTTNSFWGGGPHGALELWRPLIDHSLSFMTRIDAAGVFGDCRDGFAESIGAVNGFTRQTQFMPSTMLNVPGGLSWSPTDAIRITGGYTYEHWWDAAFSGGFGTGASRGDVWMQGIFLRGEWRY